MWSAYFRSLVRNVFKITYSDKVIAEPYSSKTGMPANHKVSVGWQIVATFFIIANFWAFYRIHKLRKYLAFVFVPSVIASLVINAYSYSTLGFEKWGDDGLAFGRSPYYPYMFDAFDSLFWAGIAVGIGFQALTIYLAIKWSREHNRRFDSPPPTST